MVNIEENMYPYAEENRPQQLGFYLLIGWLYLENLDRTFSFLVSNNDVNLMKYFLADFRNVKSDWITSLDISYGGPNSIEFIKLNYFTFVAEIIV